MKGKIKLLEHLGLALFVACALMLVTAPAAPVQAATAITDVWVEFPAENASAEAATTYNLTGAETLYRIHFKATTALVRGVDKIIVQFPDGVDTDMGPTDQPFTFGNLCSTATYYDIDADGPGTTYGYYDGYETVTAASQGGYRITLTIGVDIAAGSEVWLLIDDTDEMVTGGAESTTAYKVYVHTSKDTTPVLSHGFYLGSTAQIVTSASSISPTSAGATNVEYTFTLDLADALEVADTITVTFPYGTTLPSSMAASSIKVYDKDALAWYTCGVAPTIDTDLRRVIVTVPGVIGTTAGAKLQFATTAGITNPTRAYNKWGAVDTKARVGYIHTSDEMQDTPLYEYEVTHAAATNVDFDYGTVTGYSDKYTMINMYSSPLYLQVEDQYGNVVKTGTYATAYITLETTSATGVFYWNDSGTLTQISGTQVLVAGKKTIYYKDTTAGTYTLTASYSGLESCNWTFQVCPAVALYDRYDNLIATYAPTSTTPVEETAVGSPAEHKGGYYVQQAINAATAYDQIVLGDGHYEVDDTTSNQIIMSEAYTTLKSLNGADKTTIDGSTLTDSSPEYGTVIDVNAANVTIDGLTIKNNKSGTIDQRGIYIRFGAFTVQNCKFIDVPSDNIFVYSAALTSGTITNNTITGIGRGAVTDRSGINVETPGANYEGIKITNNTISDCCGGETNGIGVAQVGGTLSDITIQGNTITNCTRGISIWGTVTGMTGTKAIANNTITGCLYGVKASGSDTVKFDLVKNTITNNKLYGIYLIDRTLTGTALTFKYNDISGNGTWGLYNKYGAVGVDVVAKYNWWGDATGPGAGTGTYKNLTAVGSGDNVSAEASYEPWLYKSLTDVVADNVSYQACTMKLALGCWNTLSTPVPLIEAADAIDELISADDMTIGYYYDEGWQVITTGYVLNACDAVYIKMKSTASTAYVLLKFDAGAFTTPSKDLKAGWNLIGLSFLGYTDSSDAKETDDAVASVAKTAANLPGYAQVVSPSMNASQTDIYYNTGISWTYSYGQTIAAGTHVMYAGLGYWIYMQNPCTLAGFEITPIAPAFGLD